MRVRSLLEFRGFKFEANIIVSSIAGSKYNISIIVSC